MNTSLKHKKEIPQAFREILTPVSTDTKLELEMLMIKEGFLHEFEKVCK